MNGTPTSYMDFIAPGGLGSHSGPVLTNGAIGTSFLTPEQSDFRRARRKYGEGMLDDGNFYLSQVHFDKESGTCSLGQLDVGPTGWYGAVPPSLNEGQ